MDIESKREWSRLYQGWRQLEADYFAAQKALDDSVTLYMEAKGPPPDRQNMEEVTELRRRMLEARVAVNEFIATHAVRLSRKRNLPRHE